jgi:hypothetical protein
VTTTDKELERAITAAVAIGMLDGAHKEERLRRAVARVVDCVLAELGPTVALSRTRALVEASQVCDDLAKSCSGKTRREGARLCVDAILRLSRGEKP